MEERAYWIWLSAVLGAGARTDEILAHYPNARDLYEAGEHDWRMSGVFTAAQLKRLAQLNPLRAKNNIELCNKNAWSFVTPSDAEYPELLRHIYNSPLILYVQGDISYINSCVTVGVVGTRKPSNNSIAVTRRICTGAAQAGAVIISGGALGIDSAAHEGAMLGGGKTVAVLGCGLGERYLMSNNALREQISKSGALISEYSPFAPVTKASFPLRNRIISGMSLGTVVIEAGERSGSLITANCANEQGRDVFAVPGEVVTGSFTGANRLIRDGATPISNAFELLEGYAMLYPERLNMDNIRRKAEKPVQKSVSKPKPPVTEQPRQSFSQNAKKLYAALSEEPLHCDEISVITGLSAGETMAALTELELEGLIEQTAGRQYKLL